MIVLSASEINKSYGTDVILEGVSFHLNQGDRVGIVGPNGAGKTTLMQILAGRLDYDGGNIYLAPDQIIGLLQQKDSFDPSHTVLEEAQSVFAHLARTERELLDQSHRIASMPEGPGQQDAIHQLDEMQHTFEKEGGYTYKSEVRGILLGMAFGEESWNKRIAALSGGEKTRLSLAMLLLQKPGILLLDEPTNHLDIGTLKWLEQYLKTYRGTILCVSHDRYFLDQTVTRIFEADHHKIAIYEGNYSFYADQRRLRREEELKKYHAQQKEIARQEEIIRRFKGHGTEKLVKRAQSREKRLAQVERMEAPQGRRGKVTIHFKEAFKSGNDVIHTENLAKGFGAGGGRKELFDHVSFDLKRGEKVCLVGANGIGKTTLFRILMGEMEQDNGTVKTGHNIRFGYYDQEQKLLENNNTVLEEMKSAYRLYTDTEMRSILGRFLFSGEKVFVPVSGLSGGERARLSLLKMLLSGANMLLLDEPTNHLDIESKEVFEDALLDFPGTALIISHDRYFLSKVPDRILELDRHGLTEYLGNFDYYTEKKESMSQGRQYLKQLGAGAEKVPGQKEILPDSAEERRIKKQEEAQRRRETRELKNLEEEIQDLESTISGIEEEINSEDVMKDPDRLAQLAAKLDITRAALDEKYEKWLQSHG